MKQEQKYQFTAALHELASLAEKVTDLADLLVRVYNANDFGPEGANAITAEDAEKANFTLQEINDMVAFANGLQDFWQGKAVAQQDYRKFALRAKMRFIE